MNFDVLGQPWTMVVESSFNGRASRAHTVAWLALFLGLALGGVTVGVTVRMSRKRAEAEVERAQADLALATEQTRRLTMVAKNSHNAVVITDPNGAIEWCNEGFYRLTGWQLEEVVGRQPGTILQGTETDRETIKHMRKCIRRGEPFSVEVLNYRKDGTAYWVMIDAQPFSDCRAQRVGYLAIESDITERKQTALQLAQQEAQLRFVFESSPVGFSWMLNNRSDTRRVNPAHIRITGVPMERARDDAAYAATMHPDDRAKLEELDELVSSCTIDRYEIERRFVHEDGTVIWAEFSRMHYDDTSTGQLQDVSTMIDITALKEQAADLMAAKELAEEANRAKSQFLAMMSHEIRTPMNGVIGMASMLQQTELTPRQQEFARTLTKSGGDLVTIINDILDFSKIESGHLEVERNQFDLVNCVEDAIEVLSLRAAEKEIELVLELDPDLPRMVTGDSTRLRQILVNLLSNAVKFTDRGEVRLEAKIREEATAGLELPFEVSDTGIGIAPQKIPRLFYAFTQDDASTTRRYGGTGLGLLICKRLVELMGGKMWRVKWDEGPGLDFHCSARSGCRLPRPGMPSCWGWRDGDC
ncbi:MAG: PAS domain S-box protein [Candidatus Synoicihabitans palmerolidicus]|nr:PAS domain S-box protein [Candidatus Synoicihabitans palmerolidicus]